MRNVSKNAPKSFQNRYKNDTVRRATCNVDRFGSGLPPGRLQDAATHKKYWTFGAVLLENGIPEVHFGTPLGSKMAPKSHF